MVSFGLEAPSLKRLAALVHYLDIGGVRPAEASGVERVLAGLRDSIPDDDRLVQAAGAVFDGLLIRSRRSWRLWISRIRRRTPSTASSARS
jgi:hypothetical protein